MRQWMALAAMGLALAGCTSSRPDRNGPAPLPIPLEVDSIRYETSACFGACPVYAVTLRPNGTGTFEGRQHTKVTGTREFTLSKAEYDAFAARLEPYRPASGTARYVPDNKQLCAQAATDLPGVDVVWTRSLGDSQTLNYYFGCDMDKNQDMAEAIGSAPEEVPALEALIGPRP